MITLSVNNITKSYGIETIINDISFAINEGEKIGLVGSNGAGKTTLFRIITGRLEKDSGQIFFGKIKMFAQRVKSDIFGIFPVNVILYSFRQFVCGVRPS